MSLRNADGHEGTEVLIGGKNTLIDKPYAAISPYTVHYPTAMIVYAIVLTLPTSFYSYQ